MFMTRKQKGDKRARMQIEVYRLISRFSPIDTIEVPPATLMLTGPNRPSRDGA